MNWLLATAEFPWPLNHGTWLRVFHLAKALRECGDEVSIFSFEGTSPGVEKYREYGVTIIEGPHKTPLRCGKARCYLGPYAYDPGLGDWIARLSNDYDVVVLVRPNMLQYAKEASGAGCVIADMVDDPFLEQLRGVHRDINPIRWLRQKKFLVGQQRYEKAFLNHVDYVIFVSEQDKANFMRRHTDADVVAVPNGVDLSYFERSDRQTISDNATLQVTFLGNLAHRPNQDAAQFLICQIAPLIWKKMPEVHFTILGSNPGPELQSLAGPQVHITGWVEDIRPILWNSTVVLLPMQSGTGIKNKLLESWAAGVGVVATPLACQGIPARDGQNLLVGTHPQELAEQTIRLLTDPALRRSLAEEGRLTVQQCLTWSGAGDMLRLLAARKEKTV